MKQIFVLCFFLFLAKESGAQLIIQTSPIPGAKTDSNPIITEKLLQQLQWESLKQYCDTAKGHYASVRQEGLLTIYQYSDQGYESHIRLISFDGMVLEFESELTISVQPASAAYFDKRVWKKYVMASLPGIADTYHLSLEESPELLKSYYRLLGVNARDEYGWICEYSAKGSAPDKRRAIMQLIKYNRTDLIKKLFNFPNPQTRLYAADALLYMDIKLSKRIEKEKAYSQSIQHIIDSLKKISPADTDEIEINEFNLRESKEYFSELEKEKLSEQERNAIFAFRDSRQPIKTCGNNGSYKIYESSSYDLLSEKAIGEIETRYEALRSKGYF